MQKLIKLMIISVTVILASCGSKTDAPGNAILAEKKAKLDELKNQQQKLNNEIVKLQNEIAKLDTSAAIENAKLVGVSPVTAQNFTHYIELQGKIDARNISYVAPRNGQGGLVKALFVKQGDYVQTGQQLLKLDDAVYLKNLKQVESQLSYAKDLYQRQKNLWDQNIGTEVQLINAKNNVTNLEDQIATLKEQWDMTNVNAEMSGVAEEVTIRVGELFTGSPLAGHIKLVNTSNLKVTANIPENYLERVREGTNMLVSFPDISKSIETKISLTGKIIDPNSRSFYAEANLPSDKDLRPNQIALVKIEDYSAANAITIPVNTLQTDDKGKFVLVAATENGRMIARKKPVQIGLSYGDAVEIINGLQAGDNLITNGYQGLYDGQPIITDLK